MEHHKKNILKRFYIMAGVMSLLLLAIIGRVVDLQYVNGKKYKLLSSELTLKQDTIFANKGNVYASDGNLLATSMSKFTIRMDVMAPKSKAFNTEVGNLASSLADMFGNSKSYYESKLRRARKVGNRYLLIAKNVGYNDYLKVKRFPIFKLGVYRGGFIAEQRTVRAHPIGKIAERTIGYDDFRGEVGIEGAFADFLEGSNGLRWKQKIAKGQWKPISDVNEKEPINGHDVITTIDVNIQDITHHALLKQLEYFEAEHGCAVVMETATGEVKAISNLGRTSEGKYYEKRNYALWESHEPGSTFKLASLMVALEDRVIDTSTIVDTEKGKIFIHNRKVEDSRRGGFGVISAARVFELSSNVGIVKLMKEHYDENPEKFTDKLVEYGFTKPIGFKIKGEGKPYIPNPNDKKRWNKISLEWMSWGYGVSVTPMQTLMFYNAVANDGVMVKPMFVKELRRGNVEEKRFETEVVNPKIASQLTLNKLKKVMENGDDLDAMRALEDGARAMLSTLMGGRRWIWIEGNHDAGPVELGGTHLATLSEGPLRFRHIALPGARGEISGHYHPKARVALQSRSITRACFLRDESRLILPAYGTYTGGLHCHSEPLCRLMGDGAQAILLTTPPLAVPMPR